MGDSEQTPDKRFTYADYCSWPEDERWELIEGVAYNMSPAPAKPHADISRELLLVFGNFFQGKSCEVYCAPFDVRLPETDEADEEIETVVQPDILVVCDEKKLDNKGCRGAPDLVIEILSPSTASKDCIKKRALYERHGVREYWTVDPTNRMVTVYSLQKNGRFDAIVMYGDEDNIAMDLFPNLEIDLKTIFPQQTKVVKQSPRTYASPSR